MKFISLIDENSIPVYRILKAGPANLLSSVRIISGLIRLTLLLRRQRPDIVHIQFGFTRYFGGTLGEPLILLFMLCKKICKFKLVTTIHTIWLRNHLIQRLKEVIRISFLPKILIRLFLFYYDLMECLLMKISDVIFLPTKNFNLPIYSHLRKKYPNCTIIEIPHGVYELETSSFHKYVRKNNYIVILLFGSIRRGRGLEKIIELIYKLKVKIQKNIKLIIAGFVPLTEDLYYLEKLLHLIDKYKLRNHVTIMPRYLQRHEVIYLHKMSDLVIMDYSRMVGPSGSLMWALATGTVPLIIAKSGWTPEIPGIIIYDRKEIARKITKLMEDYTFYNQIRREITMYRKKYNFDNIAKLHLIVYKTLSRYRQKT